LPFKTNRIFKSNQFSPWTCYTDFCYVYCLATVKSPVSLMAVPSILMHQQNAAQLAVVFVSEKSLPEYVSNYLE